MNSSIVLAQSQPSLGELICEIGIKVFGLVLAFFLLITCPVDRFYDVYLRGWDRKHKDNPMRFQCKHCGKWF